MHRCIAALLLALCGSPTACWSQDREPPLAPTFIRDVAPALFSGRCYTCHVGEAPPGGVRFSPLCSDLQADYQTIVRCGFGRLLNVVQPEASLLLARPEKSPCMRFREGGELEASVLRWIAANGPAPRDDDPRLVELTVAPSTLTGRGGDSLRDVLTVTARWSDGVERDVTAAAHVVPDEWPVDEAVHQRASVRFLDRRAGAALFVQQAEPLEQLDHPRDNIIDRHLAQAWQRLGIPPAEPGDDATLIRRAHLNVIGRLPSPAEVRRFLGSRAADKRQQLIDALLERPEYARHWATVWQTWLMDGAGPSKQDRDAGDAMRAALEDAMKRNVPLDRLMRDCLAAGSRSASPLANTFARVHETPPHRAKAFATTFLGANLACAACHQHPEENAGPRERQSLIGRLEALRGGPVEQPKLERALEAWPQHDFAAAVVNRYWAALFGRGLVEPADAMTSVQPASHPALLKELTEDFVAHGYDLRHLVRKICNSQAYQLAAGDDSHPLGARDALFATYRPYRLQPHELFHAIHDACGVPPPAFPKTELGFPPYVVSRSHRTSCPRNNSTNLAQGMHLLNSSTIMDAVNHARGRIARLMASGKSDRRAVEELYLATVSRPPELETWPLVEKHLAEHPRREALEDILWALINTKEFLFNH